MTVSQDVKDGDIGQVEDQRNHHGEEGDAEEHAEETHPADKQQEHCQRGTQPVLWPQESNARYCSEIQQDASTPTLDDDKTCSGHCDGHDGKREEKPDGKYSEGAEHQKSQGHDGVAADVAADSRVHQP